ncbi:hypothetical protein [Mycolicibacterium goodii]|uniref:hypothetical protein n=1 Tax=Mycolicibacterium goodii TaxID=134601 RepID=UPI001950DFCD
MTAGVKLDAHRAIHAPPLSYALRPGATNQGDDQRMGRLPAIEELDHFVYSQTPGYVEGEVRKAFHGAVPLKTVVALRSITIAHHLFGLERVAIVHHTNCGTSSFTSQGLLDAFKEEQGIDIGTVYDFESLAIDHLITTLRHDVQIIRESPAVPASVEVVGYVYDIDADEYLTNIAVTPSGG